MEAALVNRPEVEDVNRRLTDLSAQDVVRYAAEAHGDRLVLTSSFGSHSAVMLHLVATLAPQTPVIFLDTGYHFPETYTFAEELSKRLRLDLRVYSPRMTAARQEALFGRRWEGDEEALRAYQEVNKVEPLSRALRELRPSGWLAGLRAEQTEFRGSLRRVERQRGIAKYHPILHWSLDEANDYLEMHDLPHHPLYAWGYRSIGDAHSTFPVPADEQDSRAGRRLGEKRECGIHLPGSEEEESSRRSSGL